MKLKNSEHLSETGKHILISYLHYLHCIENLHLARRHSTQWYKRNIQVHWVKAPQPAFHIPAWVYIRTAHWVGR